MKIFFNQKAVDVVSGSTVISVLKHFDVCTDYVAVAVNKHVVKQAEWDSFVLDEGDDVMVITAVKGG